MTETTPLESRQPDTGAGSVIRTELKHVTVLFADIVKSTRLIETMDPERASEALDPVITVMIKAVLRHSGTVTRIQGDGIMAVFGAPASLEDSAVQACFAASEMVESMTRRAATADPIEIRVGIDTGEVLVRTYEMSVGMCYDAVGVVVHMANKLESCASPNSVLISSRTEQLAHGFVKTEQVGYYRLQQSEVGMYRLLGRSQVSRWAARQSRVLCRVVGRENYLGRFEAPVDLLYRSEGSTILLEGEAGVGKSRLLFEFSGYCRERSLTVVRIEGTLYHTKAAFHPFREFLAQELNIGNQEAIAQIDRKLADLLGRFGMTSIDYQLALCSLFNPALDEPRWIKADPIWRRETIVRALLDVVTSMTVHAPLVVMAEDLHLMDRGSTEVIRRLAEHTKTHRLLLVVSQRPDQSVSMTSEEADCFIALDPLSEAQAFEMCDALLGTDPAFAALKTELVHRTGGVPLFLEEIILHLMDTGSIGGVLGAAVPARMMAALDSTRLPTSVSAILSARIDRLAPDCHDLLQIACVIGERFPTGLLREAAGLQPDAFERLVEQIESSRLIILADDGIEVPMSFSHAVVQQVCYRSMITETRRHHHAMVARAIERYYGSRVPEFTQVLARHYSEAGEIRTAIGLWQEAAHRALMGAATPEAVDALETAIRLVDGIADVRERSRRLLELLTLLGSALIVAQGPGSVDVERIYAQCRGLAESIQQSREYFRSLWGRWRIAWQVSSKLEIAKELSALAEEIGSDEELLQAHHAQWASCYNNGELRRSLQHINSGLQLYKAAKHSDHHLYYGGHDPAMCGYGEAALCSWILGDVAKGREMIEQALTLTARTKHPGSIGHALDYALFYYHHANDAKRVVDLARETIDFAADKALPHYGARARAWLGWAAAEQGESLDGIEQMSQAIEDQRQTGIEEDFPVFLEVLAGLQTKIGAWETALALCDEALELAGQSGMRHWLAMIHGRRGAILRELGREWRDASIDAFVEAMKIASAQEAASIQRIIRANLNKFIDASEVSRLGDPQHQVELFAAGTGDRADSTALRQYFQDVMA